MNILVLGHGRNKMVAWTEKEIQVLQEHYSTKRNEELLDLLPNRSLEAIQLKAHRLSIKKELRFSWRGEMITKTEKMKQIEEIYNKPFWEIYLLLWNQFKSQKRISQELNIHPRTLTRWLNRINFEEGDLILPPNRVKFNLSPTESAYIAGFIDGDGSIAICREKRDKAILGFIYKPSVTFSNTNKNIICYLANLLGNPKIQEKNEKRGKITYKFGLFGHQKILALLEKTNSYLIGKKKRGELLFKFCHNRLCRRNSPRGGPSIPYNRDEIVMAEKIRWLNDIKGHPPLNRKEELYWFPS